MTYPSSITAFTGKTDGVSYPQAAHINDLQHDVTLLEATQFAYKIIPTVASNNITVAIKTFDGSNASASVPLYFKIGNAWQPLDAALSVTKNAGTNWANAGSAELATWEIDWFVYMCWNTNTGAMDVFFSRIPWGSVYSDFSATTTNEKYAAINATAPAATDDCICIGRFAATLSAGAGYNWSVPTYTTKNLVQRPIYNTRELSYAPAITYSGGTTSPTSNAVGLANYTFNNRLYSLVIRSVLTRGGGNRTVTIFSTPWSTFAQDVSVVSGMDTVTGVIKYATNAYIIGTPALLNYAVVMSSDGTYYMNITIPAA